MLLASFCSSLWLCSVWGRNTHEEEPGSHWRAVWCSRMVSVGVKRGPAVYKTVIPWYSTGICDMSSRTGSGFWWVNEGGRADRRQLAWQAGLKLLIIAVVQSMLGLCLVSQECPKTRGIYRESITKNKTSSKWLPYSWSWTGLVWRVTWASSIPWSVLASSGSSSSSMDSPSC